MKFFKYTWLANLIFDILGCLFIAIGIHVFMEPAHIAPGGVSGIGILLKYLWNLPVGLTTFLCNIPLLFFAWKLMGKTFTLRTLQTIFISTILLDSIVTPYVPAFYGDRLLSSIFSGLLSGAGLGIVFFHGSTTGGTDILSYFLKRRFPILPAGQALLIIDASILLLSMVVYHDLEAGLFGTVALYAQMKAINGIIYGMDQAIIVLIMSSKALEISDSVITKMARTATLLYGMGAYKKKRSFTLLCIIRRQELAHLKEVIIETDPSAFVTIAPANQVLGEGFRPIDSE